MLSAEKALYLDLCSGLSIGYQWLGKHTLSIPEDRIPNTVLLEGKHLAELAALYTSGDQNAVQTVEGIIEKAQNILKYPVASVVQKGSDESAERLHDYCSLAKYWWPDSQQENGLPYVRRDGEVNPECYSERFDNERLVFMAESLQVLSLAAYLTGDATWVDRAIDQLETWFINPATRQTPHFQYAQRVPGKKAIRSTGIIESRHLIYVTEAIYLLESIHVLPIEMSRGLRQWFEELLKWMRTSENGRAADRAKNNIAYWYDLQCLAYAWFVKDQTLAEHIILNRVQVRSADQIEPDGSLPLEMKRANPLDYVVFTLAAMAQLSRYSDRLGIPVWRQTDADGRSFQTAYDWLLQQAQSREGQTAAQQLVGTKKSDSSDKQISDTDDLVMQIALVNRLAEARGRMLKDRDHWRDIHVHRINELEKTLEENEKGMQKKEQALQKRELQLKSRERQMDQAMEQKNQEVSYYKKIESDLKLVSQNREREEKRFQWLEKTLLDTKEQRISALQDQLKRLESNQKSEEKQRKFQELFKQQKEKVSHIESRFKDAQQQFEIMLEEKNNEINGLKENEKKFDNLLKANEVELERLMKAFKNINANDNKSEKQVNNEIKHLKQEHRSALRSQQRKIERLQNELDRQRERASFFKERSNKILASRSWRLTGLLRRLANPMGNGGEGSEKKS